MMVNKRQVRRVPHAPGVYFFKNRAGKTVYIGKARNLRMRLVSYFGPNELDARKRAMIKEAAAVSWLELGSDIEALIREAELIKKLRPKYNVLMRDDKQYFYVVITKEKFPKIFLTHQPQNSGHRVSAVLGPFTDGTAIKETLKTLRRIFPYCQCSIQSGVRHMRPCQQSEIGRCLGICCLEKKFWTRFYKDAAARKKECPKNIQIIRKILSGQKQSVLWLLEKEMKRLSQKRSFEEAAKIRDQIYALENIFAHRPFLARDEYSWRQKALGYLKTTLGLKNARRIEFFDVSNLRGKMATGSMAVFIDGEPQKNEYRKFKIRLKKKPDDVAMIKEIIMRRLRHGDWPQPDLMIVDGGKAQLSAALNAKLKAQNAKPGLQIAALAKREEELYLPDGRIIRLKSGPPPLLHLLQFIRNEAHRFAISYHRKLRSKF